MWECRAAHITLGGFLCNMKVVGVSGPSCSGKTTIVKAVLSALEGREENYLDENIITHPNVMSVDDYYKDDDHIPLVEGMNIANYDHEDAIDFDSFEKEMQRRIREDNLPYLLIEGFKLFHRPYISSTCTHMMYLDTPYEVCLQRRLARDRPSVGIDEGTFFKEIVWMHHLSHYHMIQHLPLHYSCNPNQSISTLLQWLSPSPNQ